MLYLAKPAEEIGTVNTVIDPQAKFSHAPVFTVLDATSNQLSRHLRPVPT